ncbi:phytanoyl-CoA dioxygenase family protein [Streptomyces sp. NPDC001273]|uniref:phytanoyl-CoA dioxygenase family protein n=1 Tax=unclassified Streptomyces TaxID=2593676 RepID=UPI0033E9EAB1
MLELSHEQARHYRSQGYCRLPNVFSGGQTAELRDFVSSEAKKDPERARKIGGPTVKLYGLYQRNPELLGRVIRNPNLIGALQGLLGPNVVFVTNRHNHATINDKQGEPAEGLHRDILQPTRGLLTAAVYLQDSTAENGATRIIPGSHEMPYVGVPQADGGGTWMAEHEEYAGLEDQALSVPMPEGGVLLFNGLAFHGVGGNTSGGSRMSMTLGFRSADELDAAPDGERQIMVAGRHIYRGNDR